MFFRVLALVVGLMLAGNAFSQSCSAYKKTPVTECLVGDNSAGKWRGVWNGIAGNEHTNKNEALLYSPGLCDAKGMTVANYCAAGAQWRPEHWGVGTQSHPCNIIWEAVKCGGSDCTCD